MFWFVNVFGVCVIGLVVFGLAHIANVVQQELDKDRDDDPPYYGGFS